MIKEDLTVAVNTIDAKMLAKMFLAGAKNLESKKEWINELNVFPVPDGDTGTNMTLTIMSAAKDVAAMNANNDLDMKSLAKAISSGSLRGACIQGSYEAEGRHDPDRCQECFFKGS